ncbi:MAG: hypothetical protein ACRCUF_08890 [Aeromonas sobria]
MTPVEKEIALHKHEANRRRLMGHFIEQGIHELAVRRLESKLPHEHIFEPVLSVLQSQLVACWMESRPISFIESMMKTQAIEPGAAPSTTVMRAADLVRSMPWELTTEDWVTILHFLEADREAFALSLPRASMCSTIRARIKDHINHA